MGKKQKLKNAGNPKVLDNPYQVLNRYGEYLNLLLNAVSIVEKGSGKPLPFSEERYAKLHLIEGGSVGYDKITNRFYRVFGEGIDNYGNPTKLHLVSANGQINLYRKACYDEDENGSYILYALPDDKITFKQLIKEATDFMVECDVAERQNIDACKTPYVVVCSNEDLRLSFMQAIQQKQRGQAVILVSPEVAVGLNVNKIEVPFLADKFVEVRDIERDALLNKLGILTSNVSKKERVQGAEVNATINKADDYIYMLIDTFNKQCENYAIPFEMKFNGSMEDIYLNDKEKASEEGANSVEKGGKANAE